MQSFTSIYRHLSSFTVIDRRLPSCITICRHLPSRSLVPSWFPRRHLPSFPVIYRHLASYSSFTVIYRHLPPFTTHRSTPSGPLLGRPENDPKVHPTQLGARAITDVNEGVRASNASEVTELQPPLTTPPLPLPKTVNFSSPILKSY